MAAELNELQQKLIDARARLADARAKAELMVEANLAAARARGEGFNDQERAQIKTLENGVASMAELVEAEEKLFAAKKARAEADKAEAARKPSGIVVGAPNFQEDPKKGFRTHREMLHLVLKEGASGRIPTQAQDERLRFLATVGSDEQGGYDDSVGGFMLPIAFSPNLLTTDYDADPSMGRTQDVPMTAPIVRIPARADKNHSTGSISGGLTVSRSPETAAKTASQVKLEQIELKASSLFGLNYQTEELLSDSPLSFVALVERGFRDQFPAAIFDEKINGTGVGQFLGILNALDSAGTGPTISIAKETGQAAATLVAPNILKMRQQAWHYSNCIWIANHDCAYQLQTMSIAIGTAGALLYQTSLVEDKPDMLLGRPIYYNEFAQTLGTTGDIMLCNWGEYLEGTYQSLQSAESIHVRFLNHERAFKFWTRNAGAPWWRSALTPRRSTQKLSPFVILATRS